MTSHLSLLCLTAVFLFAVQCIASNVTYDHRSLIIDGSRRLLISASIHYPRSVPGMWPGLVTAAKEGGVDVIETYVFWNGHELSPGNYSFSGRFDLVKFAKIVQEAGMYLMLRIGPFVAAEWNFGGVPVWLHYVPGTVFRTNSQPFKRHMKSFTTVVVDLMKREKLFATQGGPIILSQIENEYGYYQQVYGKGGKQYTKWAASMAVSQNIGVPWMMCQQHNAPDPIINTCNSFYCDDFIPNSPIKPKIWTENWPGWFKTFGGRDPHRPPEDVAFSVARFFQKGGSVQNYYMYHGGTNFGRTAGGPFITTSYDYDAPIDEYGLPRHPKWGHLKELHNAIKLCEHTLLHGEARKENLGHLLEADVYTTSTGKCVAFISNMDEQDDHVLTFHNRSYHLPAWSVSILPDCKNVAFNTAKVKSQTSVVEMIPDTSFKNLKWDVFTEQVGVWGKPDYVINGFVDHINTTKDSTDYLWYTTSVYVDEKEGFLNSERYPILMVESKGHAVHAFVNEKLEVSASGNDTHSAYKFARPISLKAGKNDIALLSMTVGLQNAGPFYEWVGAGLTSVKISGFNNGTLDLSSYSWHYKLGMEGEHLNIDQPHGLNNIKWTSPSQPPKNQPLTWYKAVVDTPEGDDPIGLDMIDMGKGQAWLNGEPIGRYWPRTSSIHDDCPPSCNYRGKFLPNKCSTGCGKPSQRWYHVPRSWFKKSGGNVLVIFEEKGGDPTKLTFSRRVVTGVCGMVGEDYPTMDLVSWPDTTSSSQSPALHLACPRRTRISAVHFASFGNPSGNCGSYSKGSCHDPNSISVIEKLCLHKADCRVSLSKKNFNQDLCPGVDRKLAVEVTCN